MNRICVLRLSGIGDVCHAAAAVHRIRSRYPDSAITWVIGSVEHSLVRDMPGVRFVTFDKKRGRQAYSDLRATLAGERFDALLLMQTAFRANLAATFIHADRRIGFDWARSRELHWLFARERVAAMQHPHVLDGFMGFAEAIGATATGRPIWDLPISSSDRDWARTEADRLGPFAIINAAASSAERNWLADRYGAVAQHLTDRGLRVVLCGGPAPLDRQLTDEVLSSATCISDDYVGRTTLKQLRALAAEAQLMIAPDTGPAHMATTVGTPVIGLYAHSNPRRTGPYNDRDRVVSVYDQAVLEQFGKPWTELPWGTRVKGRHLMERIEVADVVSKVEDALN